MSEILYEKDGHVVTITLNRPEKLNTFIRPMYDAFNEAMSRFDCDPDAWVAIITGAGDRAFCAGADVGMLNGSITENREKGLDGLDIELENEFFTGKPVIAAIRGHCVGEGMSLASSCDFRIASDDARFSWPEPRVGLPTLNGSLKATRIIGLSHALELLLMGEARDAAWAYRTGLVNTVVPAGEVMAEARRWADRLCRVGPLAVRVTKEVAVRGLTMGFDEALQLGMRLRAPVLASEDAEEGTLAFVEKRDPQFKGR